MKNLLRAEKWCNYADTYKQVRFLGLYKDPPKHRFFYDSVELSEKYYDTFCQKELLYLAVIRYQTGTFVTTHGAWHVVGISTTEVGAQKLIKNALKGSGYKPWEGYFERFEGSEVHFLPLL